MKRILSGLWVLLIIGATEAWGQGGLYGAPEVIPFPPTDAAPLQGRVLPPMEQPATVSPSWNGYPNAWTPPQPPSWQSPQVSPPGRYPTQASPSGYSPPSGPAPYGVPPSGSSRSSPPIGAYRYAQAPGPYGAPAPAPLMQPEAAPIEAPPGVGMPETRTSLPYVDPEGPRPLPNRAGFPMPEAGWGGQDTGLSGGAGFSKDPSSRLLQPGPSGGKASANLVDQMLRDADENRVFTGVGTEESPLAKAMDGGCGTESCGCWGFPMSDCPWYATVLVFMMGRDQPNRFWTSYETDNNPNQLMHTNDIGLAWRVGGEVRFGRRFGCSSSWAIEAAYWTLDPFTGRTAISHPNGVSTPINLEYVWFYRSAADWNMAADLFDNAIEHRLQRRNEFHNVEVNFLRLERLADSRFPLDLRWGLGVRWFRFEEDLLFGSLRRGTWGASGGINEAYIDQELKNDLIGAQLTLDMTYFIHRNWRIFLTPRVGIYNNHIQLDFQVYRGDGTAARPQPGAGVAGSYPVRATTDTLSFLTQVDAGVEWRFAKNWTAAIGYRAIVATGMGLADNQFPAYLVDLPEVGHIDHNGHLILHGGFASLTINF